MYQSQECRHVFFCDPKPTKNSSSNANFSTCILYCMQVACTALKQQQFRDISMISIERITFIIPLNIMHLIRLRLNPNHSLTNEANLTMLTHFLLHLRLQQLDSLEHEIKATSIVELLDRALKVAPSAQDPTTH